MDNANPITEVTKQAYELIGEIRIGALSYNNESKNIMIKKPISELFMCTSTSDAPDIVPGRSAFTVWVLDSHDRKIRGFIAIVDKVNSYGVDPVSKNVQLDFDYVEVPQIMSDPTIAVIPPQIICMIPTDEFIGITVCGSVEAIRVWAKHHSSFIHGIRNYNIVDSVSLHERMSDKPNAPTIMVYRSFIGASMRVPNQKELKEFTEYYTNHVNGRFNMVVDKEE